MLYGFFDTRREQGLLPWLLSDHFFSKHGVHGPYYIEAGVISGFPICLQVVERVATPDLWKQIAKDKKTMRWVYCMRLCTCCPTGAPRLVHISRPYYFSLYGRQCQYQDNRLCWVCLICWGEKPKPGEWGWHQVIMNRVDLVRRKAVNYFFRGASAMSFVKCAKYNLHEAMMVDGDVTV